MYSRIVHGTACSGIDFLEGDTQWSGACKVEIIRGNWRSGVGEYPTKDGGYILFQSTPLARGRPFHVRGVNIGYEFQSTPP